MTFWFAASHGKYHPTKFGENRSCCCEDITFLVSQVILQDYVIKRLYDLWDGIHHGKLLFKDLFKFGDCRPLEVEI